MEKLSALQVKTGTAISDQLELIRKEPIDRRTESFIRKKEETIKNLWETFKQKHLEIVALNCPEHEYFTKNYYQQVETAKQKALDKLSTYTAALSGSSNFTTSKVTTNTSENGANAEDDEKNFDEKVNSLRCKKEKIRIESFRKQLQQINVNDEMSNATIEFYCKTLTEDWRYLESLHEEILMYHEDTDDVPYTNEQFDQLRSTYMKMVIELQEKKTTNTTSASENDVRLPRLSIPIFEGKYETWTAFHDIFMRLIHCNKRLANVEKMQYLKTSLKGEASKLLNHLEISDNNYTMAWEIIKERYENKRKLLSVHIQTLLTLPKLEVETPNGLKRIHDTMKECLHGITNLGVDTTSWAPIIIHLMLQKFDYETLKLYEQSHASAKEIPSYEVFYMFLTRRFQSLEAIGENKNRSHHSQRQQFRYSERPRSPIVRNYLTTADQKCRYCQKMHTIYNCAEFLSLDAQQRNEAVRRNNLCRNCINHSANEKCRSRRHCSICQKPHHTLLHQPSNYPAKPKQLHLQNTLAEQGNEVLLATALIKATASNGKQELLRILIDTGSQASFITEQAVQMLSLPRTKTHVKLSGLGATEAPTALGKVNVQLQPRFSSVFQANVEALILPKLTKQLPNTLSTVSIPWKNCLLADPTFNQPGPIDMIIGSDYYTTIVLNGIRKSNKNILAQNTEFGWIISGKIPHTQKQVRLVAMVSQTDVDDQLKRFWEIEETPTESSTKSDDDTCEQHFRKTHIRNADGRYTVQIPFKEPSKPLGESRKQALARLIQNEKKFCSNKYIEEEYKKFMAEYIYLKHMELVKNPKETSEHAHYLPHQAVLKTDSTTTKLRVVFDASAKTSTGISLNDNMLAGPRLQPDLYQILLRWRKHRYVFSADIEKMYRQIKLAEADQNYHRILWRFNPNEPVREYKLTTVTYGTTSAPFLAVRTIQQLASDEQVNYPQGSKSVFRDFYVDDVMSGGNTLEDAKLLQTELISLLKAGGFKLRKWTSNHQQILKNIPEDIREKGILTISEDKTIKTLGIHWNPTSDTFHFKVSASISSEILTKRLMLSKIAQIFDPLGWITPVTLRAKLMIQELWKSGISWDEVPPPKIMSEWLNYQQKMSKLEELKIQRWINYDSKHERIELHGFSDASEYAYAAAIYCKSITSTGKSTIHLLTAKSKVAPVKSKLTIPRLELCGAELLSRLMEQSIKTLELNNPTIYFWSDSMITIARIKGTTNKQKNFEAIRIEKIRATSSPDQWNYVKTDDNPADCASRGINPDQIKEHKLWWSGPSWLKLNKECWPNTAIQIVDNSEDLLEKNITVVTSIVSPNIPLCKFSSLKKCIRVIAYCKRFIDKCKKVNIMACKNPSSEELERAHDIVIGYIQRTAFPEEIQRLQRKKPVSPKSKLLPLNPFIDEKGILRVGGRLEHSILPYEERHPAILPHQSHVTQLIIQDAHLKTLHGGNQSTQAYVRRRYWITNSRSVIKKFIHNCKVCFRAKAQTSQQIMGNLPAPRVIPSPPFTHTGVDYAGPIQLKASKVARTKLYKGYIALFVCLSTKAVHIEAVSDLTSDAFIAAFKRFTARRGHCKHIYSDCGTNFIGAQKILEKDVHLAIQMSTQEVADLIASDGTQWHFNPPSAPHMGGLWEAGIKSIKYHLKRIVGDVSLTFEELTTTLNQIEASLNSRPLCPLSNDPSDCNALTPGHFLMGRAPISPPHVTNEEKTHSCLTRWKMVNKLSDDFWKIWSSEYLSRLQQRPKWRKEEINYKIGELVLVKNENLPTAKWRLARITAVHPGKDDKTRVVTLRCGNNTILKRPIAKLCRLPMEENMNEELSKVNEHTQLNDTNTHYIQTDNKPVTTNDQSSKKTEASKRKLPNLPPAEQLVKKRYIQEIEQAIRDRSLRNHKKVRIHPVTGYSNLVPLEKQQLAREKYEAMKSSLRANHDQATIKRKGKPPSIWNSTITCLSLLCIISLGKCAYTITHPQPGLYIEDIGEARLRRGTLRVELTLPLNTTADIYRVNNTIKQMQTVCEASQKVSEEIHCEELLHHLKIQGQYLLQEINVLNDQDHHRKKRGLLGEALQYVFGVNDQVYSDISTLQQNQQILQQASLHQSSIMLTTISHMNDTETRITEKINSFTTKLNSALKEINTVQGWFSKINTNLINLHMLTAYQLATNILDELERQYVRILAFLLGKGSLLEFIPPSKLRTIIKDASSKLPGSLYITNVPEDRIDTSRNASSITLLGYFNIIEADQYSIIKITPIPKRLENNTYLIADIPNTILAINYNIQAYFELSENELKDCISEDKHLLLCIPTTISSIETNPNCIVDEIYNRQEKQPCPVKTLKIPTIIWKHLYMANTWLFVTTAPIVAGVKCNGIREDVELNGTGIIQITRECVIKTKKNTLIAEVFHNTSVRSSFSKPMDLNITKNKNTALQEPEMLQLEPVLKSSDHLVGVIKEQEQFHKELTSTSVQTIGHHTLSVLSAVIISLAAIAAITIIKRKYKCKKPRAAPRNPDFVLRMSASTPTTPCHTLRTHKDSTGEAQNV